MKIIKTQILLLSSILKTRLDEVYPNIFIALWIMLNFPESLLLPARKEVSANWSWLKSSTGLIWQIEDCPHWPCCQSKLHKCTLD